MALLENALGVVVEIEVIAVPRILSHPKLHRFFDDDYDNDNDNDARHQCSFRVAG